MFNQHKSIAAISCLLIMLSTTLAFYLLFENLFDMKLQWISLLFLLLSEAILMVKFLLIHKQTIIADAHITSSIMHIVIISLVSALFVIFIKEGIKLFVLINVMALSALIVTDLVIHYTQYHTTEKGNEQLNAQELLCICISQVQQLSLQHKESCFYTDICKIEELLRYSDNTAVTGDEAKIGTLLSELSLLLNDENADSALAYTKTNAIMAAIQDRTVQMKVIQRGKY